MAEALKARTILWPSAAGHVKSATSQLTIGVLRHWTLVGHELTLHHFCLHEATAVFQFPIAQTADFCRRAWCTHGTRFEGGFAFAVSTGLRTIGLELG